jgi:hypothetical protein
MSSGEKNRSHEKTEEDIKLEEVYLFLNCFDFQLIVDVIVYFFNINVAVMYVLKKGKKKNPSTPTTYIQ